MEIKREYLNKEQSVDGNEIFVVLEKKKKVQVFAQSDGGRDERTGFPIDTTIYIIIVLE